MARQTYQGVVVHNFATEDEAVRAIRELQAAGFSNDDISVVAQDHDAAEHVASDTDTHAPEGAATGAVAGGALGAIAALIAGASAVAIPGIGIAIGGPIAAAIAGAAGGGLIGGLIGLGIPEDEAREYESHMKRGDILVTVVGGSREAEARAILKEGSYGTTGRDVTGYGTGTTQSDVTGYGTDTMGRSTTGFETDTAQRRDITDYRTDTTDSTPPGR